MALLLLFNSILFDDVECCGCRWSPLAFISSELKRSPTHIKRRISNFELHFRARNKKIWKSRMNQLRPKSRRNVFRRRIFHFPITHSVGDFMWASSYILRLSMTFNFHWLYNRSAMPKNKKKKFVEAAKKMMFEILFGHVASIDAM